MQKRIGKYELLRKLGEGAFGVVYLARDTIINEKVALKVAFETEVYQKSLILEARLLWQLKHENIVTTYEANIVGGAFYIAMEYLSGGSLSKVIERGKLNIKNSIEIVEPLLVALEYAHNRKIIHRDIKPSNILFDEHGKPKLADFGVARMLEHTSIASTITGTVPYMAPEQLEGKATFKSDIYTMGVVLYEMLTGQRAFDDDTDYKIMRKIDSGKFVKPRSLNPKIPQWLEDIILVAMARDLGVRYETPSEMLKALRESGKLERPAVRRGREDGRETEVMEKERPVVKVRQQIKPPLPEPRDKPKPKVKVEAPKEKPHYPKPPKVEKKRVLKWVFGAIGTVVVATLIIIGISTDWGGGEKVEIPNIEGLSEEEALSALEECGLPYTIEEREVFSDSEDGAVLNQLPPAGKYTEEEFPRGSEVILTVGVKETKIMVPDLTGTSKSDAESSLKDLGLSCEFEERTSSSSKDGVVLSQSPSPGMEIAPGGLVTLTVGKYEGVVGGGGGVEVGDMVISKYKYCPDCGKQVKKDVQFCPYCGHQFW